MPKTPKKSAKKPLAKKTTAKPKAARKTKSSVAAVAPAAGSRRGFMWKVLEQKQLKQKERETQKPDSANPFERSQPAATEAGFGRFHGPRRRVG